MANYRKKKTPRSRSACNMCKPWKSRGVSKNGSESVPHSEYVFRESYKEEIENWESIYEYCE